MLLTNINENLLKATFATGDSLQKAWAMSREAIAEDRLDAQSYTILPAVYPNLYRNGIQDPLIEKLKGVYRKAWCLNQRYLYAVTSLAERFDKHAVRVIFMRDIALHGYYYRNRAFRSIYGIHLFICEKQKDQAIKILEETEWQRKEAQGPGDVPGARHIFFTDGRGHTTALRYRLFDSMLYEGAENDFSRRAKPLAMFENRAYMFDPADQLFYVCLAAARQEKIIYLSDIIRILETNNNTLDWERFTYNINKGRCASSIRNITTLISERLDPDRGSTFEGKLKISPSVFESF
ncbi:MAG: nucleotidyltransferase family protein [Candidatus Omnitrophota bacterium]|nr:nucleotidyltransferase family protein [Candidatus Omnitrophota bacterium]